MGLRCPRCGLDMFVLKKIVSRNKYVFFYLCLKCRKIWKLSFEEVKDEKDIMGDY